MRPILLTLALLPTVLQAQTTGKNMYDALWLLPYDIPVTQHAEIMQQHRPDRQRQPENSLRRYTPDNGTELAQLCPKKSSVPDCAARIRANLPAAKQTVRQHHALLQRIDRLADYDVLRDTEWRQGAKLTFDDIGFPNYAPLLNVSRNPIIVLWQLGQPEKALQQTCRRIKTGKTLLDGDIGLITAMVGRHLVSQNIDLAAHILADKPMLARHLPQGCEAAFEPIDDREATLCHAFSDEARLQKHSLEKMAADEENAAAMPLTRREQKSLARTLHSACSAAALADIRQDKPFAFSETPLPLTRFAGLDGQYAGYVWKMQDLRLQMRAFQAALQFFRQPENADRQTVLTRWGTPQRTLSLNQGKIVFASYAKPQETLEIVAAKP